MNQLDLVWPGLVVALSVAAALIVRLVASQGERAARARHRARIERALRAGAVGHERHASDDARDDHEPRSIEGRDARESHAGSRDHGDDA